MLGRTSRPLSRRRLPFLVFFLASLAPKRAPTDDPALPQDTQSLPKCAPRVSKMHPKTDLGRLGHAKGAPKGLRGTPPRKKTSKRHRKVTSGRPACPNNCGSCVLKVGVPKDIAEVIWAVHFTCYSFRVKPQYGYDTRRKNI